MSCLLNLHVHHSDDRALTGSVLGEDAGKHKPEMLKVVTIALRHDCAGRVERKFGFHKFNDRSSDGFVELCCERKGTGLK